jgi:prepilin-type N-terminal cleavage/methylation domain-containing protein
MRITRYSTPNLQLFINTSGFTLLELIITIALIGILAVIALPRLFNITNDAQIASTNAIAASLSSSNSANYAIRIINNHEGFPIKNCNTVTKLLQSPLAPGYTIKSAKVAVNVTQTCTLTGPQSTKATFLATGIN